MILLGSAAQCASARESAKDSRLVYLPASSEDRANISGVGRTILR